MTISNVLINSKTFRINIFCIEAIEIEERTSENDITKALIDDSLTWLNFPITFYFSWGTRKQNFGYIVLNYIYIHIYTQLSGTILLVSSFFWDILLVSSYLSRIRCIYWAIYEYTCIYMIQLCMNILSLLYKWIFAAKSYFL